MTKMNHSSDASNPLFSGDKGTNRLRQIFKSEDDFARGVIKDVGPEEAEQMLKMNTRNRRLRSKHVTWLSDQMEQGRWFFSGNQFSFNVNGEMTNGQHTCHAIIKSGTTQRILILSGLPADAIDVIDTGVARTASDVLHLNGIENANLVAAIVRKVLMYKGGMYSAVGASRRDNSGKKDGVELLISNSVILEETLKNPRYIESAKAAHKFYSSCNSVIGSFWGAMFYLFSEIDEDDAWRFLGSVSDGIGLKGTDPAYRLRERMTELAVKTNRYPSRAYLYWFIISWNKYRQKGEYKVLPGYSSDVSIPKII